ncbi:ATPase AAA [Desulfocurvibacter africanus]|uniref:flagellar biosynthesis protein FlhF n=1 Tax=Desulfocurvibacter africanus TaxID=873 RepID=UPI000407866F|nr:ATPase AAA [Desulfocurvibacter africanus]
MQVRIFRGADSSAALAQVKAELGIEAVILETREVMDNGRKMCEITAALERNVGMTRAKPSEAYGDMSSVSALTGGPGAAAPEWHREWSEIKSCLMSLMGKQLDKDKLSPRQRQALDYLEREGVDPKIGVTLYKCLVLDKQTSLLAALAEILSVRPLTLASWPEKIHCVAGPSGAGKTTTVIRMALAAQQEKPDLRICLVNADDRQARGRLVLRHYCELSGFSYREAGSREDILKLLDEADNFDRIYVDLPGMSGPQVLSERLTLLGLSEVDECAFHLVLSPHYGKPQLDHFLRAFSFARLSSVIWTKLDEAASFGGLINVADSCRVPISAVSWAAGFKDCMAPAENMLLWKLIFKHELPCGQAPEKLHA